MQQSGKNKTPRSLEGGRMNILWRICFVNFHETAALSRSLASVVFVVCVLTCYKEHL